MTRGYGRLARGVGRAKARRLGIRLRPETARGLVVGTGGWQRTPDGKEWNWLDWGERKRWALDAWRVWDGGATQPRGVRLS